MHTARVRLHQLVSITQGMATTGKGAGARPGEWNLNLVESGDIEDDSLRLEGLRPIAIEQNARTEKHLLKPYDLLVTARSHALKVALVPPAITRTMASATLLVARPFSPDTGIAHYLWYFLTSQQGRAAAESRVAMGATIPSLSAAALGEIQVPLPSARDLHVLAKLAEASEAAYAAAVDAARLRRETLRDALIDAIVSEPREEG